MNASLQALRTIPELKTVLSTYRPDRADVMVSSMSNGGTHSGVTSDLRNLFVGMDKTTEAIPPFAFLNSLRRVNPQFAEQSQHGGYAQQGGQQDWLRIRCGLSDTRVILQTPTRCGLRPCLPCDTLFLVVTRTTRLVGLPRLSTTISRLIWSRCESLLCDSVEVFPCVLRNGAHTSLTCDEAPEEPKSVKTDKVLKLDCNININTNYMLTGIKDVSQGRLVVGDRQMADLQWCGRASTRRSRRIRLLSTGLPFTLSES